MATGDNFITCGNDFDLKTIAMSLYGSTQGCTFLRQYCENNISNCSPISCGTFDTLTDLIRRSIAIAHDGRPALRVVWSDLSEAHSAFSCGLGLTWDEALKSIFLDVGGGDLGIFIGIMNADLEDLGTNLIQCGDDFDYDSIMQGLIGEVDENEIAEGCNFLRVHYASSQSVDCTPMACGTNEMFLDLFRRAIVRTDDGRPALRVFYITESRDTDSAFTCASGVTEDEALNNIFWSIGGEIAVALACISDQT